MGMMCGFVKMDDSKRYVQFTPILANTLETHAGSILEKMDSEEEIILAVAKTASYFLCTIFIY